MQELRALSMDRSIMRIYLQGEVIDILPAQVGLLLEGFLKQEGRDEILIAPCVLRSNNGESFRGCLFLLMYTFFYVVFRIQNICTMGFLKGILY